MKILLSYDFQPERNLKDRKYQEKEKPHPDFQGHLSRQQRAQPITYLSQRPEKWATSPETIRLHWHVSATFLISLSVLKEILPLELPTLLYILILSS